MEYGEARAPSKVRPSNRASTVESNWSQSNVRPAFSFITPHSGRDHFARIRASGFGRRLLWTSVLLIFIHLHLISRILRNVGAFSSAANSPRCPSLMPPRIFTHVITVADDSLGGSIWSDISESVSPPNKAELCSILLRSILIRYPGKAFHLHSLWKELCTPRCIRPTSSAPQ